MNTIEIMTRRFFTCDEGQFYKAGSITVQLDQLTAPETQLKLEELSESLLKKAKEDPRQMTDLREMTPEEAAEFILDERRDEAMRNIIDRISDAIDGGNVVGVLLESIGLDGECNCPRCTAKRDANVAHTKH